MDNKYYLIKFCKITGIVAFVNTILFGMGIYSMNRVFITLKEFDEASYLEFVWSIFWSQVEFMILFSVVLGAIITLMYYAQKENKKWIKIGFSIVSILIGIFLVFGYMGMF